MPDDPFADLPAKDRSPKSARILDGWISDAQTIVTFARAAVTPAVKTKRVIEPRRFKLQLDVRGVQWRSIQEGGAGCRCGESGTCALSQTFRPAAVGSSNRAPSRDAK